MQPPAIFETCLYAADLDAAAAFYQRVFELEVISRFGNRGVALRCGKAVLLLFNPNETRRDTMHVPPHGAEGAGHIAFLATTEDMAKWRAQLERCGVPIDREVRWPEGGTSLYVRDPAGNSVELAPPTLWGGAGL